MSSTMQETLEAETSLLAAGASAEVLEERRLSSRAQPDLNVTLVRDDGARIGPYRADDVSTEGVHLTLPVGYGLAVGQRYELLIEQGESRASGVPAEVGPYATVVRTQLLAAAERGRIGVGLRLDQPLYMFV